MFHVDLSLDEKMNALTHACGILMSLLGLILFFVLPEQSMSPLAVLACIIFSLSMLGVYVSSTFYHLAITPAKKRMWKRWDHAAIFFLIAGTYTPFCLLIMPGDEARELLLLVWILALAGTAGEWLLSGRFRWVSTALYLALGWLVLWKWHVVSALPPHLLNWVIAGGLFYSVGTLFYLWRGLRFHHAVWHIFVMAGSFCHYLAVMLYLS